MKPMSSAEMSSTEQVLASPAPQRRRVTGRYPIATLGSYTLHGGKVVLAGDEPQGDGFRIACVGDLVRYPDGSESIIVSGAGNASTFGNRPVALVGSHVENGDRIVLSRQSMGEIVLFEGDAPIPGLLQPGYLPPQGATEA